MSLELDNDRPLSERTSERRPQQRVDAAPAWPVLARLPRIDAAAAPPRTSLPTFAAAPAQHGPPPLTYLDPPHADHAHAGAAELTDYASAIGSVRIAESREAQPAASPPAQTTPAQTTRHYRIDRGAERHVLGRRHQAPAERPSLSDSIYHLHAAIAPHKGLLGAMALVLSAGLVYWVAIGRQGAPTAPANLLDFRSGLTQEATAEQEPPAIAAPQPSVSARNESPLTAPAIDWATPPRVANAPATSTATSTETTSSPPADAAESATTPDASPDPVLPPSAGSESNPDVAASAALDNGVTPTPMTEPYPTTSFPPFSFVDQTPAAVAQRSAPLSSDAATAR